MMTIEDLLSSYETHVQTIAHALITIVREVMPEMNEVVTGHKNISYSTDAGIMKGGVVYIAPYKDSVNLGFVDGVDLNDPQGLLAGTGKRLRHIKFKSLSDVEARRDAVVGLLEEAKRLKV